MGSFFSSSAPALSAEDAAAAAEGESRVLAFHSNDAWNAHFESHKKSNKLMVIDFKAAWCGPCRFIEPAVKALAAKFTGVDFAKIDVDELPDVSRKWNVEAMPTFVLVRGGQEVTRVVGASKEELEAKIARSIKL